MATNRPTGLNALAPGHRNAVLARTVLGKALDQAPRMILDGAPGFATWLQTSLESITPLSDDGTATSVPMELYLPGVRDQLVSMVEQHPQFDVKPFQWILEDLTAATNDFCANPSDPYLDAFLAVLDKTMQAFQYYAEWHGEPVSFEVGFVQGSRRRESPCLRAETRAGLGGGPRRIRLKLLFPYVDRRAFLSSVYVLCHEAICHSGRGVLDFSGTESIFSEGWMDLLALDVFENVVAHPPFDNHDFRLEGLVCHHDRYDPSLFDGLGHEREWAKRAQGIRYASSVQTCLQSLLGPELGRERFRAMSFDLSASQRSELELDDVAAHLGQLARRGNRDELATAADTIIHLSNEERSDRIPRWHLNDTGLFERP